MGSLNETNRIEKMENSEIETQLFVRPTLVDGLSTRSIFGQSVNSTSGFYPVSPSPGSSLSAGSSGTGSHQQTGNENQNIIASKVSRAPGSSVPPVLTSRDNTSGVPHHMTSGRPSSPFSPTESAAPPMIHPWNDSPRSTP